MGRQPGLARVALVIWAFNSAAIFLYMASGYHPMLPKLFAIWTGLNVGVIAGMRPEGLDWPPAHAGEGGSRWVPPAPVVALCAGLVLALELPCFWYSLAMGMSMGWEVQAGESAYVDALRPRLIAYLTVIVPLLLASAVAESVAIRAGRTDSGQRPSARD